MTCATPTKHIQYVVPRVNIADTADAIVIEAEMPGVAKEGVTVELHKGILTVTGSRTRTNGDSKLLYRERPLADFRRTFALNTLVDAERTEAAITDGVLKVTLHKSEALKPRKINVN